MNHSSERPPLRAGHNDRTVQHSKAVVQRTRLRPLPPQECRTEAKRVKIKALVCERCQVRTRALRRPEEGAPQRKGSGHFSLQGFRSRSKTYLRAFTRRIVSLDFAKYNIVNFDACRFTNVVFEDSSNLSRSD